MKRRNFLSLIGAASLAPTLPAFGAPAAVAAGYNRYMYGLAVFHARTRNGLTTADLMARLKVSSVQAQAMMGEMSASGVLSSVTGSARVAAPIAQRKPYVRKALRQLDEWLDHNNSEAEVSERVSASEQPSDTQIITTPPSGSNSGVQ
jgi:hypothetical protein